jgi:hypothetical protein
LNRNESGRFGALKSDSTHHFFRNACTKSGSLRIGDEFHLLFVCCNEYLVNLRRIYLPRYYVIYPSIVKMNGLLSFCNVEVLSFFIVLNRFICFSTIVLNHINKINSQYLNVNDNSYTKYIFHFCILTYFSYIMATSFSGRGSRSTRREPQTLGKQLVNFITCGCESSAPFFCNL